MRSATRLIAIFFAMMLVSNSAWAEESGKKYEFDPFGGLSMFGKSTETESWKVDLCAAKECMLMGLNDKAEPLLVFARDRAREVKAEPIGIAYCTYFHAVALQRLDREREAIEELRDVVATLKQFSKEVKPVAELPIVEYLLAYSLEKTGNHGESQQQLGSAIAHIGAYLKAKASNPIFFAGEYVGQCKPFMDPEFYFPSDSIVGRKLVAGESKETLPAVQKSLLKIAALCDIRSAYGLASYMYSAYSANNAHTTSFEQEYWRDKMNAAERNCFIAYAEHAFFLAQVRINDRIQSGSVSTDLQGLLDSAFEIAMQREKGNVDAAIKLTKARGAKLERRAAGDETNCLTADNELMMALLLCQKTSNLEFARKHFSRAESLLTQRTFDDQSQLMEVMFQKGLAMQLFEPKSDWFDVDLKALTLLNLTKPTGMMYSRTIDVDTMLRMRVEDVIYQHGGPWGFGVLSEDTMPDGHYLDLSLSKDEEGANKRIREIKMHGGAGVVRELMFYKLLYFCYYAYAQNANVPAAKAAQKAYELLRVGAKEVPASMFVQGMMDLFGVFLKHDDYLHARGCLNDIIGSGVADASEIALCYARLSDISFEEGDLPLADSFAQSALTIVDREHIGGASQLAALAASGAVAMEKGKLPVAREKIESALKAAGINKKGASAETLRLLILMTDVLKRQGEFAKARQQNLLAMKLAGSQLQFKLERSKLLQLLGEIDQAEGSFDDAIRNFRASTIELGKGLSDRDELEIAVKNFCRLADCCARKNDRKEAALYALDAARVFDHTLPQMVAKMSFAAQCEYLSHTRNQLDALLKYGTSNATDIASTYAYVMKWKGLLVELLRRQSTLIYVTQAIKPQETKRLTELRSLLADWTFSKKRVTDPEEWLAQNDRWTQEKEALEQTLFDVALLVQRASSSEQIVNSMKGGLRPKGEPKQPAKKKDAGTKPSYMKRVYGERHVDAVFADVVRGLYAELLVANRSMVQMFLRNAEAKLELLRIVPKGLQDAASFRQTLTANEAVVDFVQYFDEKGESQYVCFVITHESGPFFLTLGTAKEVDSAISDWRQETIWQAVSDKQTTDFSDLIFSKILKKLPPQINRVWISPDGELARVPFETLMQSATAARNNVLVSQIDSVRELLLLKERQTRNKLIAKDEPPKPSYASVVLVGDVDFGDPTIPNLPQTKMEIAAIKELAESFGDKVSAVTGVDATKALVSNQMTESDWIHLATHGFFSGPSRELEPERMAMSRSAPYQIPTRAGTPSEIRNSTQRNMLIASGIILAKSQGPDGTAQAGRLTAEELIGVNLSRNKLFTLSACDTGRGKEVSGQGAIGLRSAIMAAGSKCVLMSLWKVDDRATRLLMEEFYSNMWKQKLSPAESLRRAQDKVRSTKGFKDPYFWAAWILVGDAW